MTKSAKAIILSLVLTATGFAETPVQLGAWSVAKSNHGGDRVVMLQTTAQTESLDGGEAPVAKLDVICRNGKLSAIALEPAGAIRKGAISFTGPVPTTRVALTANDQTDQVDTWAVTDGGRTLTPYSEAFQGKATAHWIERIAGTQKLSFQVETSTPSALQTTFETGQLSEALFSVGCSY